MHLNRDFPTKNLKKWPLNISDRRQVTQFYDFHSNYFKNERNGKCDKK